MKNRLSIITKAIGIIILCFLILALLGFVVEYFEAINKNIPVTKLMIDKGHIKNDFLFSLFPRLALFLYYLYIILEILMCIGIISLKNWGRKGLIVLFGIDAVWLIGDFIFAKRHLDILTTLTILFWFGLVFYLTRPKVKEQFK